MSDTMEDSTCDLPSSELNNILSELQKERTAYFKNKIIYDAIASAELKADTRERVDCILLSHKLENCLSLGHGPGKDTLLGLNSLSQDKLSVVDSQELQTAVDKRITRTRDKVMKALGTLTDLNLTQNTLKSQVIQDEIKELQAQQNTYIKNVDCLTRILESILNIRLVTMPSIIDTKLLNLSTKEELMIARAKIIEISTNQQIFQETPLTTKAFEIVINDISKAQSDCQQEINNLSLLKEKYKQVKCREFDEILKSYIHYKRALEGLQKIYANYKKNHM